MHCKPMSLDVIVTTIIKGVNMNIAKPCMSTTHSNIDTPLSEVFFTVWGVIAHTPKSKATP